MSSEKSMNWAVVVTAIILFSGTAYLGYRFIQDVSRGAEKIENSSSVEHSVVINDETLKITQPVNSFEMGELSPPQDGISEGKDVIVRAGEFAYRYAMPQVRLELLNQGKFEVGGVFISFMLYLNDDKEAVSPAVILPAPFPKSLAIGETTVASFVIQDPRWRTSQVADAKVRRVVAQIVGVSDGERLGMDYPQSSLSVYLKQTANDWSKKLTPDEAMGISLRESASNTQAASHIQVQTDFDASLLDKDPTDISDLLEPPLPTGEQRIFSVEIQEYQDGQLQKNQ